MKLSQHSYFTSMWLRKRSQWNAWESEKCHETGRRKRILSVWEWMRKERDWWRGYWMSKCACTWSTWSWKSRVAETHQKCQKWKLLGFGEWYRFLWLLETQGSPELDSHSRDLWPNECEKLILKLCLWVQIRRCMWSSTPGVVGRQKQECSQPRYERVFFLCVLARLHYGRSMLMQSRCRMKSSRKQRKKMNREMKRSCSSGKSS